MTRSVAVVMILVAASCSLSAPRSDAAGPIEETLKSVVLLRTPDGLGTGFLVLDGTLVATNFHVIDGATEVQAHLQDGTIIAVTGFRVAAPQLDLAILELRSDSKAAPLTLATEQPDRGAEVLALGAPKGLPGSVSRGAVGGYRKWADISATLIKETARLSYAPDSSWVQTDAAINPGNSGGPLVLEDGTVVAINTLASSALAGQNINFAVDVSHLRDFLKDLPERSRPLRDLPKGFRHRQEPVADRSAEATVAYWNTMARVIGTCATEYQKLQIKLGKFTPRPRPADIKLPPGTKVGLEDERFGKTIASRKDRIQRFSLDAGITYQEGLKLEG